MTGTGRSLFGTLLIAGGAAVGIASVLAFRLSDWPIYVCFMLAYLCVFRLSVEVLPGLRLPIPDMAVTIGFLYIGGLPIVALRAVVPLLAWLVVRSLPESWSLRVGWERGSGDGFFWDAWAYHPGGNSHVVSENAMFALGLATRWWIARALVPDGLPAESPWAVALGEVGGYACWSVLSVLPIYPDHPLLPLSVDTRGLRSALADIGLIVGLALTPFVFLITYGYRAEALPGATAWSLSTLGLHFMLKRMNERRVVLKEQNQRLEVLNRELEHRERLSAIGKMSSIVSHQTLHQLGVIGIYTDLICNTDGAEDPRAALTRAHDHARAIEGALRDVNRVFTDLLVFSKDLRLNLYEHPLKRMLEECHEDCRAYGAERGVSVRMEVPANVQLTVDKLKIKQALLNVLRNAIEVSPAGAEVVLRAEVRDAAVAISVTDEGPGVPKADREAIFAPFFTTKERGTGLGLAIAREFADAHGGRLWVEGNPTGRGARFVLLLPTRPSAVPPERASSPRPD